MLINNKILKKLEKLLKKASRKNETPVAAIITYNDKIIAKAYNRRNKSNITIDHAEIIALNKANKKIKNWRANKCTLYVSLEPCEMCKGILKESRIENVYYFIKREETKKQYNKTNFELIELDEQLSNYIEKYKKINRKFWENKR